MLRTVLFPALLAALLAVASPVRADHEPLTKAGHSVHGESFNEGPRQAAYLMPGTGKVTFPVTTKNEDAQKFINQGVGQLHGFWYYEAERSFRQALKLDADCAMAYWGLAMANVNNEKRAKGFIAEAVKRKERLTPREQAYITAWNDFLHGDASKKKERNENYTKALERILLDNPDDLEAKAFLALQLWKQKDAGVPITSHAAIDALLGEIFVKEPLHPANHYRIHLWDHVKAKRALDAAARCGQSAPGIAHMWHMSGHTFSDLKRFADAAWQQEAAGRVDHAYMIRDRLLPDQIHNYAHNQEWLIRDLAFSGRARDALTLAKNLVEIPRHPKFNTLSGGTASFGRSRLPEVLERFELWDDAIALCSSGHFPAEGDEKSQVSRLKLLGAAQYRSGKAAEGDQQVAALDEMLTKVKAEADKAAKEAEEKARAEEKPANKPAEEKKPEAAKPEEKKAEEPKVEEKKPEEAKPEEKEEAPKPEDKKPEEKKPEPPKPAAPANKKKDPAKAAEEARKPFADRIKQIEKAIDELKGYAAIARGEQKAGLELLRKGNADKLYLTRIQFEAGEREAALKEARGEVDRRKNEVAPLALLAHLQWADGKKEDATKTFNELRELSGGCDLSSPIFARLAPIAQAAGLPEDWRLMKPTPADAGDRPSLDTLGPFCWSPPAAADWKLFDAQGQSHSLADYRGKPVVMIFFLGSGCLHCAEQLKKFAPMLGEFEAAGISVVAVSTDDREGLGRSIESYKEGKLPLLLTDDKHEAFKAYRAFDDFEDLPLHGTFLIDGQGRLRWQDIGFEPFMDAGFVLGEAKRLLNLK
jgi:peroxiredoxin/outer membrane biosynthesis protein TonB